MLAHGRSPVHQVAPCIHQCVGSLGSHRRSYLVGAAPTRLEVYLIVRSELGRLGGKRRMIVSFVAAYRDVSPPIQINDSV